MFKFVALFCILNWVPIKDSYQTHSDLVSCLHVAANKVVPNVKVHFHNHWWNEELGRLKQECIEATTMRRQFGCPGAGDINFFSSAAYFLFIIC